MEAEKTSFSYLSPSTKNVILTESGHFLDTTSEGILGIFDTETGECKKYFQLKVSTIYAKIVEISKEEIVIFCDRKFTLFNYHTGRVVKEIDTKAHVDDFLILSNSEDIVAICNTRLNIWNIKSAELKNSVKLTSRGISLALLANGQVVLKLALNDEIMIYDPETEELSKANIMGDVFAIEPVGETKFAIARKQCIQIFSLKLNSIESMMRGNNEPIFTMKWIRENNQLVASFNNDSIKIWDLATTKCIVTLKSSNGKILADQLLWRGPDQLISVSKVLKQIVVWEVLGNSYKELSRLECNLCYIEKLLMVNDEKLAILCVSQCYQQAFYYKQEIRIYNFNSHKMLVSKSVNSASQRIDAGSLVKLSDEKLVYLLIDMTSQERLLTFWNHQENCDFSFPFTMDNPGHLLFYPFDRILNISSVMAGDMISGMRPVTFLNILNFALDSVFKKELEFEIKASPIELLNHDTLAFINGSQQMEFWSISKAVLINRIECTPYIFKRIFFKNSMLFLINHNGDCVLWNAENMNSLKKKKCENGKVTFKVEVLAKKMLISMSDLSSLELWDFGADKVKKFTPFFNIKDFGIRDNLLVICSDAGIFGTQIDSIDEEIKF